MLTIYTAPKPFSDLADIQQRNAIRSWLQLTPKCQIILCGDDPSVIAAASELGVESMPSIRSNQFGTPLLDSVFSGAYQVAKFPLLCYINSDIILFDSFIEAINRIELKKFLAIGQRTNLDITELINFEDPLWSSNLQKAVANAGNLYSSFSIDYFVFTRNTNLHQLPPFVVGRPRWDNWFICNARKLKIRVVDITPVCQVIHQNHNYAHIPQWQGTSWNGPEADYNNELYRKLLANRKHFCNTQDSTFILKRTGLVPAFGRGYLFQRLQTSAILYPILRPLARIVKSLYLRIHKEYP